MPLAPVAAACPLPVLSGSGFLAVLLTAAFLEPIKDAEQKSEGEKQAPPFWSTLLSTVKLFRDKRLCLLVLLPLYCGFQQAFLAGDYTRVGEEAGGGGAGSGAALGLSGLRRAAVWLGHQPTWAGASLGTPLT